MLNVEGLQSTKRGTARTARTACKRAEQVYVGRRTSSPSPTLKARRARCKAAVPELVATPPFTRSIVAIACSKAATFSPCATRPDLSTSATAWRSPSPKVGLECGMRDTDVALVHIDEKPQGHEALSISYSSLDASEVRGRLGQI